MSDISSYLNNDVVIIVLAFIVALYASSLRVEMPEYIQKLFKNDIFRVVFLTLLLIFAFKQSLQVAFIMALLFVLVIYFLNCFEQQEAFETHYENKKKQLEHMGIN